MRLLFLSFQNTHKKKITEKMEDNKFELGLANEEIESLTKQLDAQIVKKKTSLTSKKKEACFDLGQPNWRFSFASPPQNPSVLLLLLVFFGLVFFFICWRIGSYTLLSNPGPKPLALKKKAQIEKHQEKMAKLKQTLTESQAVMDQRTAELQHWKVLLFFDQKAKNKPSFSWQQDLCVRCVCVFCF